MKTEKKPTHTPGPWASREVFNHTEGTSSHVILWRDGTKENHQYRRLDRGGNFTEHNARLIAAAPELLAALIEVLDNPSHKSMADARAAIAKASGEAI